jgi:hypothetical protein
VADAAAAHRLGDGGVAIGGVWKSVRHHDEKIEVALQAHIAARTAAGICKVMPVQVVIRKIAIVTAIAHYSIETGYG